MCILNINIIPQNSVNIIHYFDSNNWRIQPESTLINRFNYEDVIFGKSSLFKMYPIDKSDDLLSYLDFVKKNPQKYRD
jgi:hypothetical protein